MLKVIFDLDGTLADLTHRLKYIRDLPKGENPNWDAFHYACIFDQPIREMIKLNQMLAAQQAHIEIWSGRSDMVRPQTEQWLKEHGVKYTYLFMRNTGDYTPDDELKESWLLSRVITPIRPDIVFDDRDRVVQMWRRHGIRCLQVAPGKF